MPAAVAVPAITTAISAGTSLLQTSSANRKAKQAEEAINNYQRQELVNPNLGLQVSTLGADRQREDISRSISTMANQAAMGGSRAILGLAPNMIGQQMQQEQQIAANLDQQEAQRQAAVAQGQGMVMQMTEQRENADLAGLGNQLNVARQERANGYNNLIQTGLSAATLGLEMNAQGLFNGSGSGNQGGGQIQSMENPVAFQSNMAGLTPDGQKSYDQFMSMPTSLNTKNSGVISPTWLQYGNYNPFQVIAPVIPNITPKI